MAHKTYTKYISIPFLLLIRLCQFNFQTQSRTLRGPGRTFLSLHQRQLSPLLTAAESLASLYSGAVWNLRDRVLGEVDRVYYFARQRGPQWANALKTMYSNLRKIVRSSIIIVQRGYDQLVDILLRGWW